MAVTLLTDYIYLVHQRDYAHHDDKRKISEVFGCYTTEAQAERRAKAEVRSLHHECDCPEQPEVSYSLTYGGLGVYLGRGDILKRDEDGDEDENIPNVDSPEILSQPPPALAVGIANCLSQRVFALAGTQKPHSRAMINNLIRSYSGSVVPLLPIQDEIQFVVLGDDVDDDILFELRNRKIGVMRQDQLFQTIEFIPHGGTLVEFSSRNVRGLL
ncbi:hypothetical protein BDZ45DRAFT_727532 [Acephala macrosclerotiorum]|nr:hypothetical protein BDZ45DRAFT_727532 [Acephala macrosclerotiorum]